jgi:hypothetical protein
MDDTLARTQDKRNTQFWCENLHERARLEDLSADGVLLNPIFKEQGGRAGDAFI